MGIIFLIFKIILFIIIFLFLLEISSFVLWFLYYRFIKKLELPANVSQYKTKSIFQRLLFDFPKQFWLDRFNRIPRRISRIWFTSFLWRTGKWKNN